MSGDYRVDALKESIRGVKVADLLGETRQPGYEDFIEAFDRATDTSGLSEAEIEEYRILRRFARVLAVALLETAGAEAPEGTDQDKCATVHLEGWRAAAYSLVCMSACQIEPDRLVEFVDEIVERAFLPVARIVAEHIADAARQEGEA